VLLLVRSLVVATIVATIVAVSVAFGVFDFVHVLYVMFEHEQVGSLIAMEFYAAPVIPLDAPSKLFAVLKHEDHRSAVIHLLLVIKALGVSLLGRYALAIWIVVVVAAMLRFAITAFPDFGKCRSYQFPIHRTSSSDVLKS